MSDSEYIPSGGEMESHSGSESDVEMRDLEPPPAEPQQPVQNEQKEEKEEKKEEENAWQGPLLPGQLREPLPPPPAGRVREGQTVPLDFDSDFEVTGLNTRDFEPTESDEELINAIVFNEEKKEEWAFDEKLMDKQWFFTMGTALPNLGWKALNTMWARVHPERYVCMYMLIHVIVLF